MPFSRARCLHHGLRQGSAIKRPTPAMLALLAPFSSSTIQPPCAPYIKGHAHLSSRPCMRADLDFGDLNRPVVYMPGMMTGFKERFQPESARRVSIEDIQSCDDESVVGCDLESVVGSRRGHSGGTSSAAIG